MANVDVDILNLFFVLVYTERWFRLRGNLLFYFKTKDKVC